MVNGFVGLFHLLSDVFIFYFYLDNVQISFFDEREMNENPFETLGDDAVAVLLQSVHDEDESLLVNGVTQYDFGHHWRRRQ